MARVGGRTVFGALKRGTDRPDTTAFVPRRAGELVWLHAGEIGNLLAVHDLAVRLTRARVGCNVLITLPPLEKAQTPHPPAPPPAEITQIDAPAEHPAAVSAFVDHWKPNVCTWVWGGLRPNLIRTAHEAGCALYLIDADRDGFERKTNRWVPDNTRRALAQFDAAFTRSAVGHRRLSQLGVPATKMRQTTPLLAGGDALGCNEREEAELSAALGGRPVWFATHITRDEISTVLAAHRHASRLSHRLLLILQPAQADITQEAAAMVADQGMTLAQWDDGALPDEATQVLISEDIADRGLFFRAAPLCFLGATLHPGDAACDPLDAAALGSAVLYGPKVRHFMPSYSRLVAAGAARIVNDADALGAAVASLIAPDHAAAMAHAGWDVISQGATLTDSVIDRVQERLDKQRSSA
ncbi:MAG: glycosyltransferase N-terminal domain-containing protein [Pseudomonadota bacterium]